MSDRNRDYIVQMNSHDTTYDIYDQRIGFIDKNDETNVDTIMVIERDEETGLVEFGHKTPRQITGLENVDNVADLDKPISTATQSALDTKVDKVDGMGLSHNDFTDDYKSQVESNTANRHSHNNKTLLDTYNQTNADIKDAVDKRHVHSNKEVLDSFDETFINRHVKDTMTNSIFDLTTTSVLTAEFNKKQDLLTWDTTATEGSLNSLNSGSIYNDLLPKQERIQISGILKGNNNGTNDTNVEQAVPNVDYMSVPTDSITNDASYPVLVKTSGTSTPQTYAWKELPNSNSAMAHNGIYRGINLLDKYTVTELSLKINPEEGEADWSDIYIGDYIVLNGIKWVCGGFNYFKGIGGSSVCETNHIVMIPATCITTHTMNNAESGKSTALNDGSYSGCDMRYDDAILTTIKDTYISPYVGSGHILTHPRRLGNSLLDSGLSNAGLGLYGYTSSADWEMCTVELLSEGMVYGSTSCASSIWDNGDARVQLPIFKLDPSFRIGYYKDDRTTYFLSDLASKYTFACVNGEGTVFHINSASSYGIRPYFLFR